MWHPRAPCHPLQVSFILGQEASRNSSPAPRRAGARAAPLGAAAPGFWRGPGWVLKWPEKSKRPKPAQPPGFYDVEKCPTPNPREITPNSSLEGRRPLLTYGRGKEPSCSQLPGAEPAQSPAPERHRCPSVRPSIRLSVRPSPAHESHSREQLLGRPRGSKGRLFQQMGEKREGGGDGDTRRGLREEDGGGGVSSGETPPRFIDTSGKSSPG